jgi:hypothetical protein
MRARWAAILASIVAIHFAVSAGANLYVSSNCQQSSAPGCQLVITTASAFSLPLLPVALQFFTGMGWRRAFVVLSINSILVGTLITCSILLVARLVRARPST